jgi:ABC-type transport system involved in cytochrome c biogenesis permease subunit
VMSKCHSWDMKSISSSIVFLALVAILLLRLLQSLKAEYSLSTTRDTITSTIFEHHK